MTNTVFLCRLKHFLDSDIYLTYWKIILISENLCFSYETVIA